MVLVSISSVNRCRWWNAVGCVLLALFLLSCEDNTAGGVDADNDGVRDDIAAKIGRRWDGDMEKAALQYARLLEEVVIKGERKEDAWRLFEEKSRTVHCLLAVVRAERGVDLEDQMGVFEVFNEADEMATKIHGWTFDSRQRRSIYSVFDEHNTGHIVSGLDVPHWPKGCDFAIE